MRRLLYLILFVFLYGYINTGCKATREIPVKTETVYNYIDSLTIRDSVIYIPVERYVDIAKQYDTLFLETSLASAEAWLDTSMSLLRGEIRNKQAYTQKTQYIDHYITRDSIVYQDRPVPYEVEKIVKEKPWTFYMYRVWFWLTIATGAVFAAWKLYFKRFMT